jgi:hypothetical protein
VTASLILGGCVSAPVKLKNVNQGHWKARALVRDKEQNRSYIVNLNFNSVKAKSLRMDVTNVLGLGVATMVVRPKQVRYVLFDSKRFYFGKPQVDVMRPILSIPFDPRWIDDLLFDEPIAGRGWSCSSDASGFVKECRDASTGMDVTWSSRNGDRKTVMIEHPKASVQINVQSFQPKVENRKNLFVLEAPDGFQQLRVR